MILLIDNYDSFVFNLARYFEQLGHATQVVRNDEIDAGGVERLMPEAVVLSPGPCTPSEAGCSIEVITQLHARLPILGICLGHQAIAAAFGGLVLRAPEPVHGRASQVFHDGIGPFAGLQNPLAACRYHSLIVDEATLPACLRVSARTADGLIMGLAHRRFPTVGLQFHPESILTESGYGLLAGFLRLAGLSSADPPDISSEQGQPNAVEVNPPSATPVTF